MRERRTSERPVPDEAVLERDEGVRGGVFWGLLRLSIGWIFLWAFWDKLLGLGFATGWDVETGERDILGSSAWINGGDPTAGFLQFGLNTVEPFESFYAGLAEAAWVDWVYMLSMLAIGTALVLGILVRVAAVGAILWMLAFYTASALPPENNPFMDEHLVYAIALAGIAYVAAGRYLGLGRRWERLSLVRRYPILR